MEQAKALSSSASQSLNERFKIAFGLTAVIWIVGLVGHFTPLLEWPALAIYVLGSIVWWSGAERATANGPRCTLRGAI